MVLNLFSKQWLLQITAVKGVIQQTVMNTGKVDITGREAGFSKVDVMELIATPSPAPGNFFIFYC